MSCNPIANAAALLFPISCTTLAAAWSTGLEKLRNELSNLKGQDQLVKFFDRKQNHYNLKQHSSEERESMRSTILNRVFHRARLPSHYKLNKGLWALGFIRFILGCRFRQLQDLPGQAVPPTSTLIRPKWCNKMLVTQNLLKEWIKRKQSHRTHAFLCYRILPECTKSPHSIPFRLDLVVADKELSWSGILYQASL